MVVNSLTAPRVIRTGSHRFAPVASVGRLVGLLVGCTVVDTVVGTGSMIDTGLHRVAPGLAPGGLVDYRIFGPVRTGPVGTGWHRLASAGTGCIGRSHPCTHAHAPDRPQPQPHVSLVRGEDSKPRQGERRAK